MLKTLRFEQLREVGRIDFHNFLVSADLPTYQKEANYLRLR